MKTEDYEELKSRLEGTKFEVLTESEKENDKFFVVKMKDVWEGVEFAECKDNDRLTRLKVGEIYRFRHDSYRQQIFCKKDLEWMTCNKQLNKLFQPSNESAYIEQLKNIAFEKHDDKLELSKIDDSKMNGGRIKYIFGEEPFIYRKDTDTLYWCGVPIYQQGRWASKLPERVKVRYEYSDPTVRGPIGFYFQITGDVVLNTSAKGQFLAQKLEEYLNQEK